MVSNHSQPANGVQMPDGTWKREGPPIMMVPLDSARQWYPREDFVACNADHSQIAKLKRGENSIYPSVRWAIKKALLSAGDLYSEAKGIHHSYPQHLRSVDEPSTMRRSLLEASHRQVSALSNERLVDPAPLPSRSLSENVIDQQIKEAHQMKIEQSTHHGDAQSNSNPLKETIAQWQASIEDHKSDDTQSSSIPTDHARTDMTSVVLDDSFDTSKSTGPAASSVAEANIPQKPKGELNPDSAKIGSGDVGLAPFQPEALENATDGAKSMIFDENFLSVIVAGDEEKTREFLARKYDVNCKGDDGITPLLLAARHKRENILRMLLEQGANPRARDIEGQTTLHQLTMLREIPISETLIDLLLRDRPPLDISDSMGNTPLMFACASGENLLARKLISHGADVCAAKLNDGVTPLHYAVFNGNVQIIPLLITNGADPGAKRESGYTPLHDAALGDSTDAIEQLLLAGADKEATVVPSKSTPLLSAVRSGKLACVTILLQNGVNVKASDSMGKTSIHLAASQGQLEMVKALLDHGADPDARDDHQETSLTGASAKGQLEVVKTLLHHGANPDARNWNKRTSLHRATIKGQLEVIKALLDHGANPTFRDILDNKPSMTPMSDDVTTTEKELIRALLEDAEKAWKLSSKKVDHWLW